MIDRINTTVVNPKIAENNKQRQSFKGVGTGALGTLKFLNDSPAIGACAVDLCSMVIPRTAIEMKNRGPQAGIEAAFREGVSCLIHACVGVIGLGAAKLISGGFNKNNNIKAENIFANSNTIDNISKIWQGAEGQKQFFDGFLQNIKGLNGTEWKKVSDSVRGDIVNNLVDLANKTEQLANTKNKDLANEVKQIKDIVLAKITKDTGARASFELQANGQEVVASGLGELVDNAVLLSNAFKTKSNEKLPEFVESLKRNKKASTALGMLICAVMCMSVQPLNKYLTKKRTGQDGFVGVDGKEAEKPSKNFKTAKKVLGIAFSAGALRTIGKYKDLPANIQFNGKAPTINQFKFLYGLTIGSRFMSARDGNELRESIIKDTLGYTNWLILGGMVSKLTARALGGKELINNPVAQEGKKGIGYAYKWLSKASVKSFDEVLMPKANEIIKDGKAVKFSDLFKNADSATKSKIAKIATSQVAGYLYSGIVLGVGISKLNIFITKKVQAKKNAKNQATATPLPKLDLAEIAKLQTKNSTIFKDFN